MNLSWANLSTKYKIISVITLGTCLLLLYYKYIFLVQQQEKVRLGMQCEVLRQELTVIENFAISHPEIDKYQAELDVKKIQADQLLPDSVDISGFLLEAEKSASRAGIQLLFIRPGSVLQKQGYCEIPVEIIVSGDYFHILNFYKQLQTMRLNTVRNLYITAKPGLLESKLSLVIYSYKESP